MTDQERDIRLRISAIADTGTAQQQLRALLEVQAEIVAMNDRQRQADAARSQAAATRSAAEQAEANRTKGILESLDAKFRQLQQRKREATTVEEITRLNRELTQTQRQMDALSGATQRQTNAMRGLGTTIGAAFGTAALLKFGKDILFAGSNAESFGISLETILRSKEKADQVAAQAVELAKKTPFTLQEVQEQIVKLSAYNIEAAQLVPTVKMLGDIAAGVGKEKLPFLTLAYGQVRAANKLTGQELRQFTEAGVPLLELLAQQSGKSVAQIQADIPKAAIKFEDVRKALAATTAEGGKFFNLMERRSGTVEGKLSNLSDSIFQGMVRIEKQFDSAAKGAIDWMGSTVNALVGSDSALQRTGNFVKAAVAAWITYKAVQISVAIQTRINTALQAAEAAGLTATAFAANGARASFQALSIAIRANPVGILITLLGTAVSLMYAFKGATTEVTSAIGEQEKTLRTEQETLRARVSAIMATNENERIRLGLIKQLRADYPELLKGLKDENVSNLALASALRAANREYRQKIELARIAYNAERNAEKQKTIFEREAEAVDKLKEAYPEAKIQAQDLAGAARELEAYRQRRQSSGGLFGDSEGAQLVLTIEDAKRLNAELRKEQEALDQSVQQTDRNKQNAEAEKERNYKRDLRQREDLRKQVAAASGEQKKALQDELALTEARIKAYEEANAAPTTEPPIVRAEKQWHNDRLTRLLNEAKAMDQGLARELAINKAEEEIAADKARFEKKTEAEIQGIRLDYAEKRRELIEKEKKEAQQNLSEISNAIRKTSASLTEARDKEAKELKKLADENSELLFKEARERATSALGEAIVIDNRIARLALFLSNQRAAGKLTKEVEAETNNEIIKLRTERTKVLGEGVKKELQRVREAESEKRKLYRETMQLVVTTLSNSDAPILKSFANILTAYQQFEDVRQNKEATASQKFAAKVGFGIQSLGALSQAYFNAEAERFKRLEQQATAHYDREKKALSDRHTFELSTFRGTEAEKANLQRRQKAEEARLEDEYNKKKAALQLKQFRSEQAQKISQTVMAGALAGVQAFAQLGPIGGAIAAGIIGALTITQVALIAKQKPPQFYEKGTDYVRGPKGRDKVPAMLTEGEAVLTVAQRVRRDRLGLTNESLLRTVERLPAHRYILEGLTPDKQPTTREMEKILRSIERKVGQPPRVVLPNPRRGYNPDAGVRHRSLFGN